MNTYVALLRGINVGGANRILKADLKALFIALNFSNPVTYLQSGNIVFSSDDEDISGIEIEIKSKMFEIFGYNIEVFVISDSLFREIYERNVFLQDTSLDIKKMCVIFLKEHIDLKEFNHIKDNPAYEEKMVLFNKTIYMYYINGFGRTKVSNNYFEKKLKVNATSRNWNTVTNLVRLLEEN